MACACRVSVCVTDAERPCAVSGTMYAWVLTAAPHPHQSPPTSVSNDSAELQGRHISPPSLSTDNTEHSR